MTDKLAPYWLSLHAGARQVDRDQALLGALGVAAFAYPHQIDSVAKMATAPACRFLLADEVGLGKTIQALMLLRALASHRETGLRVALVTPDDLNHQWIEELCCRTHVGSDGVPVEPEADAAAPMPRKGRVAVDLFRPARLAVGAVRLNAKFYDMLVVDEYTKLSKEMRDLVGVASRSIPNVLLLSATPAMHDPAIRRAILEVLEPDLARRCEASGEDILDLLAAREDIALAHLRGDVDEPPGLETPAGQGRDFYTQTHGAFRRLIRTRRADYPEALPQRRYGAIVTMPTDGDVDRMETARRYLSVASAEGVSVRSEALLQSALASPQALINRASTLKRSTPRLALAQKALDAAARDPGDAKLDALIDHLRATFRTSPTSRVVVVADDNRSVDDLSGAIEKLVEVKVARKRRAYGDSEVEMHDHVADLREELESFENGEASVLVAADVAAEGHNFQFASEIIFYVLPWDPKEVDQWIGRLDRLGGRGLPGNRVIRITPIVTRDSIEARILEVYEAADIFSGGRVFNEDAWTSLADAIDAAAYGRDDDWRSLIDSSKAERNSEEGWKSFSELNFASRTSAAKARFDAFAGRHYAVPLKADNGGARTWFIHREIGVRRILAAADQFDVLRVEKRSDKKTKQHYQTLWYAARVKPGDITVPEIDERHSGHHRAVLYRRGDLRSPPNSNIGDRRLHFLDHGDPVHDSVIDTFAALPWPSNSQVEHIVRVSDDHPAVVFRGQRIMLMSTAFAPKAGRVFDKAAFEERVSDRDSQTERDVVQVATRRAYEAHMADQRWFTDLAPPEFFIFSALLEDGRAIDPGSLIGAWDEVPFPEHVMTRNLEAADLAAAARTKRAMIDRLQLSMGTLAQGACRRIEEALPLRRFQTRIESREAFAAAEAVEAAGRARGGNLAFDRARRRANELATLLTEIAGELRETHLDSMAKAVMETTVSPRFIILNVQGV